MNTPQNDLTCRFTFAIECYESVLDDDPAEVWFCTEDTRQALLEAYDYFSIEESYTKIEVLSYEKYERIAVLYR